MSYLTNYKEIDGGYVAFGENPKGGKITGKGTKDDTSRILKSFITRIENLVDNKVKVIRCDNETEFKNSEMNQFCEMKGILRESIVAGTPQQNGVAKKRNIILIEAARTMLADSKLPTTFLAEAINTACYSSHDDGSKPSSDDGKNVDEDLRKENECKDQEKEDNVNSTNNVNTVSSTINTAGTNKDNELPFHPNMPALEDVNIFNFLSDDEDNGLVADMNNLDKDHPLDQVIRDLQSAIQTRKMSKNLEKHGFPLLNDEDGEEVDAHMYRSMIGSLMYLTSSRPDIMFSVCACARYQVTPKVSHLHAVKRIFRDLLLADEEGIDCLPNSTIFEQFALMRGNTLQSDEDRLELNELMALYTNLQTRVLDLEKTKTTQSNEIASLKRRVKKLEKNNKSRTHKLKRLYKVGLTARAESSRDKAIEALKTLKPKVKGIVIHEQEESGKSIATTSTIHKQQLQDKGKGIMIEEPVKTKKKDQIRLDEEAAKRLQAEFDKEERLARERAQKEHEANIALIET
uniref:Putative ribonuclease H-like domain-containing protein n=1 Tax=Tanacetum cinerariifolium TaxID=118510 RepID=A0A6L2M2T2_TANCI|nr:putative ribonuclease H-like domain-containing protein [Tanacetum cinerariifolium]